MINELMKVADAVKALPETSDQKSNLQPLPKASASAPCIRIWLTSDGLIDCLEKLVPEHVAQLAKYAPNKFSSLPGFNVTFLHGLPDEARKKEMKKTLEGLDRNFHVACEAIEGLCGNKLIEGETLAKFLAAVRKIDASQFQGVFDEKVRCNGWGWKATPGEKISVFLDIKEYTEFPVAHPVTTEASAPFTLATGTARRCKPARTVGG